MDISGSMMFGVTTLSLTLGLSFRASATFRLLVRDMLQHWLTMLCISLEDVPKRELILAILRHSELQHADGTHSKIWALRHRPVPDTA